MYQQRPLRSPSLCRRSDEYGAPLQRKALSILHTILEVLQVGWAECIAYLLPPSCRSLGCLSALCAYWNGSSLRGTHIVPEVPHQIEVLHLVASSSCCARCPLHA